MVEFRILRRVKVSNRRIRTLDFRRADLGPFRYLLGRKPSAGGLCTWQNLNINIKSKCTGVEIG